MDRRLFGKSIAAVVSAAVIAPTVFQYDPVRAFWNTDPLKRIHLHKADINCFAYKCVLKAEAVLIDSCKITFDKDKYSYFASAKNHPHLEYYENAAIMIEAKHIAIINCHISAREPRKRYKDLFEEGKCNIKSVDLSNWYKDLFEEGKYDKDIKSFEPLPKRIGDDPYQFLQIV